jgi:SpoVK/Ycf46/Vps4 family AAA+-type ATPase
VKTRLISLAAHFASGSASATRGLLLYGPPGTGKTTIARTFAESMGCAFFPLSLTDLKSGFIGQSGENVKALWSKARAEPRAVIFVDECEGVFGRRGGVNTDSFVEEIVTAFLAQWDGFEKQTHVWVVGATNRRDLIDPALLSRFEDQLEIGLPDGHQRLEILAGEFARLTIPPPLPAQTEALTAGMSGRDLVSLARRVAREHGTKQPLSDDTLAAMTAAMRKQGSTATDAGARWDTLILSDDTLKELKTTAGLLQHAETFRKRGIGVPRGLLLYGPPGTGKTQIARTLANETGLRFIAASTADIKQGFLGQSGQKVRELFERARESAPSLLFIDEIDIVAAARGGPSDSILTEIVGQLLQEMDGIAAQTQPVFVLAATNRRDQIDAAVLSRLPKQIEIPLPERDGIVKLLQVMLRDKPLAFDIAEGAQALAARADGKSGRDLRSWVESAEHRAVARAIEAGDPEAIAIELRDFD